ncbi:sigma-70 family RNA polymerase sigma factor [Microbacterium sp. LWO12-1.2]|uniref:sigma-70 family RNA polymerase sigma factor n=1 Tax=Microbacterium sp. LWO12-1.2 TaxID=3135261 RepID=UPI00342CB216
MIDPRSDAELLSALRAGDRGSYEALWRRHADAARRYAYRLFPARADDLVSESFLAIYQQVTTTDKGPQFAFRSYLKTVIRNTAIAWRKDAERVLTSDDVDQVELRDGLSALEQQASSADVLAAFQALPERWQRVLWLAEVDEADRPEIAKELGIKPNAVSALQRRARTGLKFQWLSRQIPVSLRDDTTHVARLIPQYLTEPNNAAVEREVADHLSDCAECSNLLQSMRGGAARLQGRTLAVLLGAAGLGTPAVASLSSGTVAAAAFAGFSGWLLAGTLGAATVGGIIVAALIAGPVPLSADTEALPVSTDVVGSPASDPDPERTTGSDLVVSPPVSPPEEPVIGRRVFDPTVPSAGLSDDPDQYFPTAPNRPQPAGPDTPGPGTNPESPMSPGVSTPTNSSGYLSPVIAGRTEPGQSVVVAVDSARYTPTVADDGSWSFDTRALQPNAGTYAYEVWAYDATSQSAVTSGTFTVLPIQVQGLEQLTGFEDMLVDEAQTTGVVIAVTGPPNGRVFITSMEGHSATIALDQNGYTRKRLLMDAAGWYHFTMRALDSEGYWGPGYEKAVDVYDPDVIFDPWGGGPDSMTFELVDP